VPECVALKEFECMAALVIEDCAPETPEEVAELTLAALDPVKLVDVEAIIDPDWNALNDAECKFAELPAPLNDRETKLPKDTWLLCIIVSEVEVLALAAKDIESEVDVALDTDAATEKETDTGEDEVGTDIDAEFSVLSDLEIWTEVAEDSDVERAREPVAADKENEPLKATDSVGNIEPIEVVRLTGSEKDTSYEACPLENGKETGTDTPNDTGSVPADTGKDTGRDTAKDTGYDTLYPGTCDTKPQREPTLSSRSAAPISITSTQSGEPAAQLAAASSTE
jgi:hypothetical protein